MPVGLDMYLYKTKKVEGLTAEDYGRIDEFISEHVEAEEDIQNLPTSIPEDLRKNVRKTGKTFSWYTIFETVGYWCKANQIHNWFVENVQDGVDQCQYSLVSKEQLQELIQTLNEVLENPNKAEKLLPTVSGFFFGSTDYSPRYFDVLKNTKNIVTTVLSETDFEHEVILYHSSW